MEKDEVTGSCELLVIGGSAGSLKVILSLLPALRQPLKPAIIIVLHRRPSADSSLEHLLRNITTIPVQEIEDKDPIEAGTIYIAPVDYHLLVEKEGVFSLDVSEKVNFSRPSIDITFESAAGVYGPRLACLLLSGASEDGVQGLAAARAEGGNVAVQDPATAQVPFMPQSAILRLDISTILKPEEMAAYVNGLYA